MTGIRPYLTREQSTKAYHRPGWEYYQEKFGAEREAQLKNAKQVLKVKQMKAGGTRYTFSIRRRGEQGEPYLVITGDIEKTGYRGSIVVFAPYVPDFLRVVQQMSKESGF